MSIRSYDGNLKSPNKAVVNEVNSAVDIGEGEEGELPPTPPPPPPPINVHFEVYVESANEVGQAYMDGKLDTTMNPAAFAARMVTELQPVFDKVEYDSVARRFCFTAFNDIISIKFLGGLSLALGLVYGKELFGTTALTNRQFYSVFDPCMSNGLEAMHVFSRVMKSVTFGGKYLPLLKIIPNLRPKDAAIGQVITKRFDYPMYMPVAVQSINTIDITIKNQSHELLPFVDGSKTIVTLHFKRAAL